MSQSTDAFSQLSEDSYDTNATLRDSTTPTRENSAFSALRRAQSIHEQARRLPPIQVTNLPYNCEGLSTIEHKGKRYILEESLVRRIPRKSWIGKHGLWLARITVATDGKTTTDSSWWACEACDALFNAQSTSAAAAHLNKRHSLVSSEASTPTGSNKRQRTSILDWQKSGGRLEKPVFFKSEFEFLKDKLLNWIIDADLPFRALEHPDFRSFVTHLNPEKGARLLPSDSTIARWLEERYRTEQSIIQQEISSAISKVHLSFDLWTSPNSYALLAIVGHYLDSSYRLQTRLLAMTRVRGHHGGENLAPAIIQCVQHLGFEAQLGFFQADNVESNDKCVTAILRHLYPDIPIARLTDMKKKRRVRCFGHVLNLVAKALLEGESRGFLRSLDPSLQIHIGDMEEEDLLREWRKHGAVGKLHNIVHFVRRSPQRRDSFAEIMAGKLTQSEEEEFGQVLFDGNNIQLQLKADNDTRWNSVYFMIERAIQLRDAVEVFCNRWVREKDSQKRLHVDDVLNPEDWVVLTTIKSFLEPIKMYTKTFEGNNIRFAEVIPTAYKLIRFLKEQHTIYSRNLAFPDFTGPEIPEHRHSTPPEPHLQLGADMAASEQVGVDLSEIGFSFLQGCLRHAIKKLKKYIHAMESAPVYWVAMILHPGHRMRWIQKNMEPEQAEQILSNFKAMLEEYEVSAVTESPGQQVQSQQSQQSLLSSATSYLCDADYYDTPEEPLRRSDEIADYLGEPVRAVDDVLLWWRTRREKYPRLSQIALDILTIPAMSSECERSFSQAKLVLGLQRQAVHDDTLEMLQCMKNWLRNRQQ